MYRWDPIPVEPLFFCPVCRVPIYPCKWLTETLRRFFICSLPLRGTYCTLFFIPLYEMPRSKEQYCVDAAQIVGEQETIRISNFQEHLDTQSLIDSKP